MALYNFIFYVITNALLLQSRNDTTKPLDPFMLCPTLKQLSHFVIPDVLYNKVCHNF